MRYQHVTLRQLQQLSFRFFYCCAKCLDDVLRNSVQRLKIGHAVDMLTVWLIGDLFQLDLVRVFDADCVQNNSPSPQFLSVERHIILRLAVCDHHSDLRHILAGPASSCLHKVLSQREVQALSSQGAAAHVRQPADVLKDVLLVLMGVEPELGAWSGAVLDQADADVFRPDVEAVHQRIQKPPDLLKVLGADAPRSIHHEDDVGDSLLSAD